MTTLPKVVKRKSSRDVSISPPPLRRKINSSTTPSAVASFFKPASQKTPERIIWQERAADEDSPSTLLVGKFDGPPSQASGTPEQRRKVAAFDLDQTLIEPISGKTFPTDSQDWKWWDACVKETLHKLYHEDGFRLVIVSNQGGITLQPDPKKPKAHSSRLATFKGKLALVLNELGLPTTIYAATGKDNYRKPRVGMWAEILGDYDLHLPGAIDLDHSIFVGDAAGRNEIAGKKKDFSCSDRNFAENVGLKFYTPEEFFLREVPRPFTRSFEPSKFIPESAVSEATLQSYAKLNAQDIVLFCGSPGAGKSTFYWKQLEPLGYARINQDLLKTKEKCMKVADELLAKGKSVAIDNTNAGRDVRARWIEIAAKHSIPIRCVLFTADAQLCGHNAAVRAMNKSLNPEARDVLPGMALTGFKTRYEPPLLSEGFQDLTEMAFKFSGSEADLQIWRKHWT